MFLPSLRDFLPLQKLLGAVQSPPGARRLTNDASEDRRKVRLRLKADGQHHIHERHSGSRELLCARSIRRQSQYSWGRMPVAALNCPAKCMRVRSAAEAMSAMLTDSARLASMCPMARFSRHFASSATFGRSDGS